MLPTQPPVYLAACPLSRSLSPATKLRRWWLGLGLSWWSACLAWIRLKIPFLALLKQAAVAHDWNPST